MGVALCTVASPPVTAPGSNGATPNILTKTVFANLMYRRSSGLGWVSYILIHAFSSPSVLRDCAIITECLGVIAHGCVPLSQAAASKVNRSGGDASHRERSEAMEETFARRKASVSAEGSTFWADQPNFYLPCRSGGIISVVVSMSVLAP